MESMRHRRSIPDHGSPESDRFEFVKQSGLWKISDVVFDNGERFFHVPIAIQKADALVSRRSVIWQCVQRVMRQSCAAKIINRTVNFIVDHPVISARMDVMRHRSPLTLCKRSRPLNAV